jgi:hypothetical protein
MGTNYYLHAPKCFHCGKEEEPPIHLGKSSWGWCFSLHVSPEDGIYCWEDIQQLIEDKLCEEWRIENEYGDQIGLVDFVKVVTERSGAHPWDRYELLENHAVQGPNNLARYAIDNWHCIGHGEGTYDYIIGEFS